MKKPSHDEWLRDVKARQRNVVFPDTVSNEGRFWRNLYTGSQKLTTLQAVGLSLMALMVVGLVINIFFGWGYDRYTSWEQRLAGVGVEWLAAFAFIGGFLLLLRWGTRRK